MSEKTGCEYCNEKKIMDSYNVTEMFSITNGDAELDSDTFDTTYELSIRGGNYPAIQVLPKGEQCIDSATLKMLINFCPMCGKAMKEEPANNKKELRYRVSFRVDFDEIISNPEDMPLEEMTENFRELIKKDLEDGVDNKVNVQLISHSLSDGAEPTEFKLSGGKLAIFTDRHKAEVEIFLSEDSERKVVAAIKFVRGEFYLYLYKPIVSETETHRLFTGNFDYALNLGLERAAALIKNNIDSLNGFIKFCKKERGDL